MNERSIFLASIDLPAAERSSYLDGACGGNEVLRAGVEALIAVHEKSGSFLNAPADANQTLNTPDGNAEFDHDSDLSFLQSSTKSGSLGRLGHYECMEILGRGGFGIVFKAFDEKLHRIVAIKAMNPALAATSPPRKRFLREARAAAAIKHEHVVAVFAVEELPLPYLVMEFVSGETLQQHIDRTGPLELPEIVRFSKQIALGLDAAHATGLIHRDIKPGNILIESGPELRVKITDFGLARAADDASLTQSGMICGTPMYMSPEQAAGKPLDPRSDLFSLGSVMYVMCSGRPPFRAESTLGVLKRVAEDTPRPIREIVETMPEWLCAVIGKLHEKDPTDRYANAREVAEAVERAETNRLPIVAKKAESVTTKSSRTVLLVLLALFLVGGCAISIPVLGWFFYSSGSTNASSQPPNGLPVGDKSTIAPTPPQDPVLVIQPAFTNSIGMKFVKVPKGTGWLAGGSGNPGHIKVEIEQDFYLGKYEVTQEEWEAVTGQNPSHFSRKGGGKDAVQDIPDADLKRFPVENVSWDDCQLFLKKLNEKEKESGWVYRLPNKTEWEYACRGGPVDKLASAFDFYSAKPTNTLSPELANLTPEEGMGLKRTCKVGSYESNVLGLCDMHGNVWEWCDDTEKGSDGASYPINRGSGWCHGSGNGRAAIIQCYPPSYRLNYLGLRLARVPLPEADSIPQPDYAAIARGKWTPLLQNVTEFNKALVENPSINKGKRHLPEYFNYDKGVLECRGVMHFPAHMATDSIIRTKVKKLEGPHIDLWLRHTTGRHVSACFNGDGFFCIGRQLEGWKDLKTVRLQEKLDGEFEFAFAALGRRLIVFVNGKNVLEAVDDSPEDAIGSGVPGIFAMQGAVGAFREIQVQSLDAGTPEDRKAAEWVLSVGGKVRVRQGNVEKEFGKGQQLPEGNLRVRGIFLGESGIGDAEFANLRGLTGVKSLDFGHFHGNAKIGNGAIPAILEMQQLEHLSVWGSAINDVGFEQLSQVKTLKVLSAGRTRLTDHGLAHLAKLTDLVDLNLVGLVVSDRGLESIRNLSKIETINLGQTLITDDGLKALADWPKLKFLDISWTKVTGAGLLNLKSLSQLTNLGLPGSKVTDDSIANVKRCTGLKVLFLDNTDVGDAGLEQLKEIAGLEHLFLWKTKVTADGVKNIAKAMPNCKIEWDEPKK